MVLTPRKHLRGLLAVPHARHIWANPPVGTPKGPPAPRMAGGPFGAFDGLRTRGDRGAGVTEGQEALAFSDSGLAATGAGLAAS
ncbi:hypothetical protein JCM4814A_72080 [Streptomyces phaeofaciens JCM 4814]